MFDTHAHYTDRAFAQDRAQLLAALPEQGVSLVMLAGCSPEDSQECAALADTQDYLYAAAGVHPECVDELKGDWLGEIRRIAQETRKYALSEKSGWIIIMTDTMQRSKSRSLSHSFCWHRNWICRSFCMCVTRSAMQWRFCANTDRAV